MKHRLLFIMLNKYKNCCEEARVRLAILSRMNPKNEAERVRIKLITLVWEKVRDESARAYIQMRNLLMLKYDRYVKFLAIKYLHKIGRNSGEDIVNDFIQESNIGLLMALENFDHNRGVKFTTYASYWVKAYLFRASVSYLHSDVDIPVKYFWLFHNYKKAKKKLEKEYQREPKLAEIAQAVEMPVKELEQFIQVYPVISSLEKTIGHNDQEENLSLGDILCANNVCPIMTTERSQLAEAVKMVMNKHLNNDEFQVVTMNNNGMDFPEIGKFLGIRSEKVRQVFNIALRKIRPYLRVYNN